MEMYKLYTDDGKDFDAKPDTKEILRYMQLCDPEERIKAEVEDAARECLGIIRPKASYMRLEVRINNDETDLKVIKFRSKGFKNFISGEKECVLFCATIGTEIDRLITKYQSFMPHKALMYQAIGAELIEKYCDHLCEKFFSDKCKKGYKRFSPGYSDFDIKYQKEIISVLNGEKYCGITLSESMIMRPSKSVTAICCAGEDNNKESKCSGCGNKECSFRDF